MNLAFSFVLVFFVSYSAAFYDDRNALGLRPTTVVTSTSVSIITCTKSTAACVPGRRRRDLVQEDIVEQFPIAPSTVDRVEPTLEPLREGRAADPQQVLLLSPVYGYQPQSGIFNGNYRPVGVPYYNNYPPQIANDERLNLGLLTSLITSTRTSTVFSISISTSTPACSTTGTFLQCPNA